MKLMSYNKPKPIASRPNHGLQTAYEFGEDIGGMERSRYFGYSKDLYHFDHFMGKFHIICLTCGTDFLVSEMQQSACKDVCCFNLVLGCVIVSILTHIREFTILCERCIQMQRDR